MESEIVKIYFCLGWDTMSGRSPILGLGQFNVLVSAASLWQKTGGRRLWAPILPPHRDFILDSGGFSLLTSYPSYPFSMEEYLDCAKKLRPNWIVARDWPCEPWGRMPLSISERIERTVNADAELIDSPMPDGVQPLPVIQGWEVRDYLSCIDQLKDQGLIRGRMAVGSCCARKSVSDILPIARAIREELPDISLHYFGLKVMAMREPGFTALADSIDTGAWQRWVPVAERYDEEGHLRLQARGEERMDRFYRYRRLLHGTPQTTLSVREERNGIVKAVIGCG